MKIVLTGIQGCGKGTQSELLISKLDLPVIGMGDLLRWHIENSTDISVLYPREAMDAGELAPEEATEAVMQFAIEENTNGFIIDGYPRNEKQYTFLSENTDIDYYIQLDLSEKEAINRMKKRNRADDSEEGIKTRLAIYNKKSKPLLDLFEATGKLIRIDASGPPEQVHDEICKAINI